MSQESINVKLLLSNIREKLENLEKNLKDMGKGLRLTNFQKENISLIFQEFVDNTHMIEQNSFEKNNNLYIFSEEFQLLTFIKDYLYKKPFSIFACFNCKSLIPYQQAFPDKFKKEKRKIFHICEPEILGEGITTNWKALYYLFYKDNEIRMLLMNYLKIVGDY